MNRLNIEEGEGEMRGKKKGSLRRITEDMKQRIYKAATAVENRELTRDALADKIDAELVDEFGKSPSIETLKRLISTHQNAKLLPEDEYWGVSDLKEPKYALHPETKRAIFDLKARGHHGITIREALWIDHLMGLPLSSDLLFVYAWMYAQAERLAATLDIGFDTSVIDASLEKTLSDPEKAQSGKRWDDEESMKRGISELLKFGDLMMQYDDQVKEKDNG